MLSQFPVPAGGKLHSAPIDKAACKKTKQELEGTCLRTEYPGWPSCGSASTSARSRLPYFQYLLPAI